MILEESPNISNEDTDEVVSEETVTNQPMTGGEIVSETLSDEATLEIADTDDTDDEIVEAAEGYQSTFVPADKIEDLDDDMTAPPPAPDRTEPAFDQSVEEIMRGVRPGKPSCPGTPALRGGKLYVYDWLSDLPEPPDASDLVEVQFKNTRKAYYRNQTGHPLHKGDIVAVESSPGHDIGQVTLSGRLVYLQMHKARINPTTYEFKKVYRIARQNDLDKWEEAKALEKDTMLESRKIADDLHLNMKIGDVEYQGDRTKAIFYYIADERVDFRELIKVLADRFKVRIEMKQIGARQEAGRIGGIGPCGREMCCASWMTNFVSVTTHAARVQDLSLNPVKLAGQCGKLKCCLNYELDVYLDAMQHFPPTNIPLQTEECTYHFFKYDIFKGVMWYSPKKDGQNNIVAVDAERVREIQEMNARGEKPDDLGSSKRLAAPVEDNGYSGVVELGDLSRFDNKSRRKKNRNNRQDRQQDTRQGNAPKDEEQNNPQNGGQNGGQNNGRNKSQHGQHQNGNRQNKQSNAQPAENQQNNSQGNNLGNKQNNIPDNNTDNNRHNNTDNNRRNNQRKDRESNRNRNRNRNQSQHQQPGNDQRPQQ